ncbi:hypothetical protein [Corallibacter sp.]|uniref:hypothetical protein n=1 Tax=Corallibacter sp. TaxID=2038084 RepID=UPI003A8FED9F
MKKILTIILSLISLAPFAQENNYDISLGLHIPSQVENIPSSAKSMLSNKLGQVITANGIGENSNYPRFIIAPNLNIISKDILGTAPTRVALNIELTLYIGDGISGDLFASESFSLKGVGLNENKAYIQAIKQLKTGNKSLQNFIANGKSKIIDYYNTNCDQIVSKAKVLENQNNLEEALSLIANVPVSSDCFSKVEGKIKSLYQKAIDRDCKVKLLEAQSIWAANQDINAANEAGALLASIEPQASCFRDVKALFSKIESRVIDLQDRDWKYKLKVLDAVKDYVQAAKEINLAYAKNQPKTVMYNVHGWYH